jgi:hypothetical protein
MDSTTGRRPSSALECIVGKEFGSEAGKPLVKTSSPCEN